MRTLLLLFIFLLAEILCNNKFSDSKKTDTERNDLKKGIKGKRRELTKGVYEKIRIYVDKYLIISSEMDDEKKNVYNYALDKVEETLETLIKVEQETNPINIANIFQDKQKYEGFTRNDMNQSIINNELNEDLVILVRTKNGDIDDMAECLEKSKVIKTNNDGRPIIGYIVINTDLYTKIDNDLEHKKEFFSYLFLHQITHILGFNKTTLTKNKHTNNHINIKTKIINRVNASFDIYNENKTIIYGSELIKKAKNYFKCQESILTDGIELEDKNTCDDEYIHWESRILLGDYMTTDIYLHEQVISDFTLALLVDTGFYQVNYYTGDLMKFGKNQGCDFFKKDCNIIEKNGDNPYIPFKNEFCSQSQEITCSPGRQSRGICEESSTSIAVEKIFQRTNWIVYGNEIADYCPISNYLDKVNKDYSYVSSCRYGRSNNFGSTIFDMWDQTKNKDYSEFSEGYGESFGERSFCAFSSVIQKNESEEKKRIYGGFIRPTCYQMFCSERSLTIKIESQYSQYIVCPRKGGYIKIGGNYTGYLLCPDYNLICSKSDICNNMFDCVKKLSHERNDLDYEYVAVNVSISIPEEDEDELNPGDYEKEYELSENGICPKDCSECNLNFQCFECRPDYVYIGVRENDKNPIKCNITAPKFYYYQNKNSGIYFKCIDKCMVCSNPNECSRCEPEYKLQNNICVPRIEGCGEYDPNSKYNDTETNNNYWGYKNCSKCNNTDDYYCKGENKSICVKIGKTEFLSYYFLENGCVNKCEDSFPNCTRCNLTHRCLECKSTHYLNNTKDCLEKIPYCDKHDGGKFPSECEDCDPNYYCIGTNRTKCISISNISTYYHPLNNKCLDKCSNQFPLCLRCEFGTCFECEENYFVNNNQCLEKLPHCLDHSYNAGVKLCERCENDYYCVNKDKSVCEYIETEEFKSYYYIQDPNVCVDKCRNPFSNCLECDHSYCKKCKNYYNWDETLRKCVADESAFNSESSCSINIIEINKDLKKIDLADYTDKYYTNFNSLNAIDHYVNKDYTITVFINSRCTEDLLNQGYFKIDSEELQASIKNEFNIAPNKKIFYTVFVTHNFKSHFRYHDEEQKYIDTRQQCDSCKTKEYTITNNYIRNVDEALGPYVASLVESEKINIFERDSDVYSTNCQNITLLGIDMPQKERLFLLYPDKLSEQMACLGEQCEIQEFNLEESTCTCKCKMGNEFEDILNETLFAHYQGPGIEVNNFIDSIGIVKCLGNGFNSKNVKSNGGFFICIISIVAQIGLYIYYILCSKPIVYSSKSQLMSNPPKRFIMLFSDWSKKIKKNIAEEEVFIQPRDDAEEQLLEEEKSYSNEDFNSSNFSIGTNVEPVANLKEKNKLKVSEKADKRILILLKNKAKGKKPKENNENFESDSEIINLQNNMGEVSFCKIYWSVVSLKQHIINYFSCISCCKITKSYIPLPMRIIRSLFIFVLSFIFNILFLNQNYYEKKFNHFNEKYTIIHAENMELKISTGEIISYAFSNTFITAMISFILLIISNFIIGFIFFSIRNEVKDNSIDKEDLISKTKIKNNIFFIINIVLMLIFLLTITAFCGAYGGGFADYFIAGIISLIFLEIFPFLWSLIISLLIYLGNKKK